MAAAPIAGVRPSRVSAHPTPVGIEALLRWAFAAEAARLDWDPVSSLGGQQAPSFGMEYVLLERARLGCQVDGGGSSDPHPDADVVAAALAELPERVGGRMMAVLVADHARAGTRPDWMPGAVPAIRPADWFINRSGRHAVTADAADLGGSGWPAQTRRNRRGVLVSDPVRYCPVTITPTPAQIASARRVYLGWYGALLELGSTFQAYGGLSAFRVTSDMPPLRPWQKGA